VGVVGAKTWMRAYALECLVALRKKPRDGEVKRKRRFDSPLCKRANITKGSLSFEPWIEFMLSDINVWTFSIPTMVRVLYL
jgi:hypothetical protein